MRTHWKANGGADIAGQYALTWIYVVLYNPQHEISSSARISRHGLNRNFHLTQYASVSVKQSADHYNRRIIQSRIQIFWKGGRKKMYQPRRHLSQMHTANYMYICLLYGKGKRLPGNIVWRLDEDELLICRLPNYV